MPINHVVVLMLENRSFDHILGDVPGVAGVDQGHPRSNSFNGVKYQQEPGASRIVTLDPHHEWPHVIAQVADGNGGFVGDYGRSYPQATTQQLSEVMRYHGASTLPALHKLAENFTVCDHWYAPVPGPTWPNRLFAMSGTSLGRVTMPEGAFAWNIHWYSQTSIFDRLNEKRKNWKVYYGDFPLSFLLVHNWQPENVARHHPMTAFYTDAASANPAEFPDFAFIEPEYFPPGPNDAHPPHDIESADALVASVYNALRANEALWKETLLVVLFDEHGGFYDHEPPIEAVPPDANRGDGFDFTKTGVRVPAILVSPFAEHKVISTPFDHTSLLKFLIDKWGLGPLYNRTAHARTFAGDLLTAPRAEATMPASIIVPPQPASIAPPAFERVSHNQSSMIAFSHALESMVGEADTTVAARGKYMLSNAQSQADVALDRVDSFVENMKARARESDTAAKK